MSAYRPICSADTARPFEYVYSAATRFLASIAMVFFCTAPMGLVTFGAVQTFRAFLSWSPAGTGRALAVILASSIILNCFKYAQKPARPRTADGCIPDDHPAEQKRVAVIGAGITGLMAAKELLAEGHEVTIFEASAFIGGAWASKGEKGRGRVWPKTVTSSSAMNTGLSDFPLDSYFPKAEDPYHVPQAAFEQYISDYVEKFKLLPLIRLRHPVLHVSQSASPDGEGWIVTFHTNSSQKPMEDHFDFLAVCTGQVQTPQVPRFSGQDSFSGEIIHVSSVLDDEKFAGKNVVCVGSGETGSDITEIVAGKSKSCVLSIRNPFVCLARQFYGVPPDFYECRSIYVVPFWVRWLVIKPQALGYFLLRFWDTESPCGRKIYSPDWRKLFGTFINRTYFKQVLQGKRTPCSSLLVTKTERFVYALDSGACSLKPGIERLDRNGVYFEDGSYKKCETVLLFTGYDQDVFPIFGENHPLRRSTARSRYLLTFDIETGTSVGFFGFCRGHAGSLIVPSEMQTRWFALLVSGKRQLPTAKCMHAGVDAMRKKDHGYSVNLGGWFLANHIARYHVGCEPSGVRLILRHGIVVAWRVFTQSFAAYMFRFEGPHANPDLAERIYTEGVATCGKPIAWHFLEVFIMGLGVIFDTIWHIPVVGKLRVLNPLIDRWW